MTLRPSPLLRYDLLSNHALVVWCVAAALYLAFLFRSNSVAVLVDLTAERERNWQAEVASQNARMRAQQREIRKLRLRAGHGAESDDDDGAGAKEA